MSIIQRGTNETATAADPAPPNSLPPAFGSISPEEAATVLRALPYGGIDDSTKAFRLPPAVQATVSPVIAAIRWGAVMFGMVFAAVDASNGELPVVQTLAVVLFVTTWRTLRPIRLASVRAPDRIFPYTDTVITSVAVGLSGSFQSPFIFSVLAVATVGAFGWGLPTGLVLLAVSMVGMWAGGQMFAEPGKALTDVEPQQAFILVASMVITVALSSFARSRLLDAERRRANLAGRLDMLAETNDLLHILNQVARTLPTSLDLREALLNARDQLRNAFDASVIALMILDDATGEWVPRIADGCSLSPSSTVETLPEPMQAAVDAERPILVHDLGTSVRGVSPQSASGIYTAISARDRTVGVLAVEHPDPNRYTDRDMRIMDGLSEVLALTVDNARSFRRLRTLGAEEERSRIARDLHDRLGQWLSYINFELERIITTDQAESPELNRLHSDVQTAIDELRETLRQLRSGVSEDTPLSAVAKELVERFNQRGGAVARFHVPNPDLRLPVPVENELLRVLQEALSNIDKHASANNVDVTWEVAGREGVLTISDDGRGFDPQRGVRDNAYGLVGMRERADVVGARLTVESTPGQGTTIKVHASNSLKESTL